MGKDGPDAPEVLASQATCDAEAVELGEGGKLTRTTPPTWYGTVGVPIGQPTTHVDHEALAVAAAGRG